MNSGQGRKELLELLEQTLDAFGADMRRWPDAARLRLTGFVARDAEAKARIEAERAFEAMLDRVPVAGAGHLAQLQDRVLASVSGSGQAGGDAGAKIIPWPGTRRGQDGKRAPVRVSRTPGGRGSTAALLAASLLIGVFAGTTDAIKPFAQRIADNIGIAADFDPVGTTLVDDSPELNEWEVQ